MQISKSGNKAGSQDGFSMVEIIVAIAIISILSAIAAPKLSVFFSGKRKNVSLVQNYIAKTFDDAFLNYHNNYLVIHLNESGASAANDPDGLFEKTNALSVLNIEDSRFVKSKTELLQPVEFNSRFVLESVLLDDSTEISSGYVLIPFYREGFSMNRIIHVRYNDDSYLTVFISKFEKEPYIFEGKLNYENIWNEQK